MFVKKTTIEGELDLSDRVLRYLSFDKFMDLIHHKRLYFPKAKSFYKDDNFESSYTKLALLISKGITIESNNGISTNKGLVDDSKDMLERAFVSCWTFKESENMALWKLYGGKNSIAIETTVGNIKDELDNSQGSLNVLHLLKKSIIKVDYINHKSSDEKLTKELLSSRRACLTKKAEAYSYEQEVRIIIDHIDENLDDLKERLGSGIEITINLQKLIKQIYLSPQADVWFYDLVKSILKDHDMDVKLSWSNMHVAPKGEVFTK